MAAVFEGMGTEIGSVEGRVGSVGVYCWQASHSSPSLSAFPLLCHTPQSIFLRRSPFLLIICRQKTAREMGRRQTSTLSILFLALFFYSLSSHPRSTASTTPESSGRDGPDDTNTITRQLYKSILLDDTPTFSRLLSTHGSRFSNASVPMGMGDPLLHTAILFDRSAMVGALVRSGADVNGLRDVTNSSALDVALYLGRVDLIDTLLEIGARSALHEITRLKPLHIAAMTGNIDSVRSVLGHSSHVRGDVNAPSNAGSTPLHCVADLDGVKGMWDLMEVYQSLVVSGTTEELDSWISAQGVRVVMNPPPPARVDLRAVVDELVGAGADFSIQGWVLGG